MDGGRREDASGTCCTGLSRLDFDASGRTSVRCDVACIGWIGAQYVITSYRSSVVLYIQALYKRRFESVCKTSLLTSPHLTSSLVVNEDFTTWGAKGFKV